MLGLRENKNGIVPHPTELDLSKMSGNASGSFSKNLNAKEKESEAKMNAKFADKNPFKMKKGRGEGNSLFHEGFNRR